MMIRKLLIILLLLLILIFNSCQSEFNECLNYCFEELHPDSECTFFEIDNSISCENQTIKNECFEKCRGNK